MTAFTRTILIALALGASMQASAANEIELIADGVWKEPTAITGNGSGTIAWNVWIDARVENLSYEKTVGIVWTDDGWQTHQTTYMQYEATYADGHEQWGVDITPIGQFNYTRFSAPSWTTAESGNNQPNSRDITIDYAVFYEANGETYWDNNDGNDYQITIDSVVSNNQ